ncbi:hypothetical protein WA026_009812 [Henosepilachna vigintioctopunctata]|uniref:Uncharacterized protein n=1 Tax=Henosepilachna vigintioctopunctata TaxID=420089 RepID=A0AAW1TLA9_9CUCU
MLHGMIPAAFFATLMRRYLDSLVETQEYVNSSSALTSYLGPSAVLATAGFAVYGLTRLKKHSPVISEIKELKLPIPESNTAPSSAQHLRKKATRTRIRKRRRKGKQWFLKNMRHYKSKYGRRIGKLMNQLLGKPFTESPTEPIDTDDSDDEHSDDFQNNLYEDDSENDYLKNPIEQTSVDQIFPDDFSCQISNLNEDDSVVASKDDFDEGDESAQLAGERRSSLDLKDLLRENFERQKMRKRGGRSSVSGHSRRSSRSRNSSKSDSHRSRSSSLHNGYNSQKLSRRRSKSQKYNKRPSVNHSERSYSHGKNVTKKTRSGKCYDTMTSLF